MSAARRDPTLFLLLALAAPTALAKPQKLFEFGDMRLTAGQVPKTLWAEFGIEEGSVLNEAGVAESSGIKNEIKRWPEGVVNYELSKAVKSEHKALIRSTLARLETKLDSCIKFREVNSGFRVIVDMGDGCNSLI